ncbi:hypothetical protein [Oceanobacillus manasiensis]|uniref:hypothetical protein n=1 Tax=Oceanobacillus manasiensis TaxID=586413 RepID=UPI0005A94B38|nr:hypothetical protein [Oceanobacillus manasiensis]
MALKKVRIEDKGQKPQYQAKDVFDKSSDVTVYNVFDQDWATLQTEGLARLFDSKAEFERRKKEVTSNGEEKANQTA